MLVVEINDVNLQTTKRIITGLQDVRGAAVDADVRAVVRPFVTEFGGEDHLASPVPYRPSHQDLVLERTVHVRRIEKIHPTVECFVNGGDRLFVVAGP